MTLEEKAKTYVESLPPIPADDIPYAMRCAYIDGATDALASLWEDPKEELPSENEQVLILAYGKFRVATYDVQNQEFEVIVAPSWCEIIRIKDVDAWLRIPPVKGGDL